MQELVGDNLLDMTLLYFIKIRNINHIPANSTRKFRVSLRFTSPIISLLMWKVPVALLNLPITFSSDFVREWHLRGVREKQYPSVKSLYRRGRNVAAHHHHHGEELLDKAAVKGLHR